MHKTVQIPLISELQTCFNILWDSVIKRYNLKSNKLLPGNKLCMFCFVFYSMLKGNKEDSDAWIDAYFCYCCKIVHCTCIRYIRPICLCIFMVLVVNFLYYLCFYHRLLFKWITTLELRSICSQIISISWISRTITPVQCYTI